MKKIRELFERNNKEKGQSLVEFAVSLVVILLILAGVCDLGRMFFYYISMRDAAQEGVLYGSAYPANCAEIRARTRDLLSSDNATEEIWINGEVCESAVTTDACSPNTIDVTVEDPNFILEMPIFGGRTITLNASANGTILRPQCD